MTDLCPACAVGLYEECWQPEPGHDVGWIIPCGLEGMGAEVDKRGGRIFDPEELTDDTSAGRKRAALTMPILNGMRCEWEGLKFAGGGVIPILGCRGNTIAQVKSNAEAQAAGVDEVGHLHHGPDKSVINNAPGINLHRVCSRCHNRWHALNDKRPDKTPYYSEPRPHPSKPWVPNVPYYDHDPTSTYTDEEYERAEEWWALAPAKRPAYPFAPTGVRIRFPMSEPPATVTTATENPFESEETLS